MNITLTENMKIVTSLPPGAGTDFATWTTGISLKNTQRLVIVVNYVTTANPGTITLWRDTDVGMVTPNLALLANPVKIWYNQDTDASDTLVRQLDGIGFAPDANTSAQIIFDVDPASLGLTADNQEYSCLDIWWDVMAMTEVAAAEYIAFTRYPQALPPTIIEN